MARACLSHAERMSNKARFKLALRYNLARRGLQPIHLGSERAARMDKLHDRKACVFFSRELPLQQCGRPTGTMAVRAGMHACVRDRLKGRPASLALEGDDSPSCVGHALGMHWTYTRHTPVVR